MLFRSQGDTEYIDKLLQSFTPSEVVLQRKHLQWFKENFAERYYTNTFDDWVFTSDFAEELLMKQFGTASLKGFGVEDLKEGVIAAGAALYYLQETQHDRTQHITKVSRIDEDRYVWLDKFTVRNLELVHSPHESAKTLLTVVDRTLTPMGSRLMRRWLVMPLKNKSLIEERLKVVDYLVRSTDFMQKLQSAVRGIGDLERLTSKASVGRINPRELVQMRRSLESIEELKKLCASAGDESLAFFGEQINPCKTICKRLAHELNEDPPARIDKGGVIAAGVDAELDELRDMAGSGRDYLVRMQQQESDRTGIPSLKIGFNNVFGYYLEVTNVHKNKVPAEWTRRQTLTNAERYITPELKEYEEKILGAQDRILTLESSIYGKLLAALGEYVVAIQNNARLVAQLDCLQSFANVALAGNYCRPELSDNDVIDITDGRHPVIETQLPLGEQYVANSVRLDRESQQIIIITGPNMSGKSALLRQTALIVLMAQMGSFVPAKSATVGVVDRVFTRIGASDDLASGRSTFMVEMSEVANILRNATSASLLILDEIGRGTSTYDGMAIARAILEYCADRRRLGARTMFATHYHELSALEGELDGIRNYNITAKKQNGKLIFLRKIVPGAADDSYGIEVAKLAGVPDSVINRAKQCLEELIETRGAALSDPHAAVSDDPNSQISFADMRADEIRETLRKTDLNTLTPLEAMNLLYTLQKKALE